MPESIQEYLESPVYRRRLLAFVLGGAVPSSLAAYGVYAETGTWVVPTLVGALLGASIGTFLWLFQVVGHDRLAAWRSLTGTLGKVEADARRLADLRMRALADPVAATAYIEELRAQIGELQALGNSARPPAREPGTLDPAIALGGLQEELAAAEARFGKGTA